MYQKKVVERRRPDHATR